MRWLYGTRAEGLTGRVELRDARESVPTEIIIHRNTVHEIWFKDHPHMTCLSDVVASAEWYREPSNPWRSRLYPYHWFVQRDGEVYQIHDTMTVTPHARGHNRSAVGIALGIDGRREKPNPKMLSSLKGLLGYLHSEWPAAICIPHSPLRKRCPGQRVDVAGIWSEVVGNHERTD